MKILERWHAFFRIIEETPRFGFSGFFAIAKTIGFLRTCVEGLANSNIVQLITSTAMKIQHDLQKRNCSVRVGGICTVSFPEQNPVDYRSPMQQNA